MKKLALVLSLLAACVPAVTQEFSAKAYSGGIFRPRSSPAQLSAPGGLEDHVVSGKLRLTLDDAVALALINNSDVNASRAQSELANFSVQRAHAPFDTVFTSSFAPTRSNSPSTSTLSGAATLSTLNQSSQAQVSQQFQTGTNLSVGLNSTRATTNSSFATVNPSFSSGLAFSLSQPLWRRAGLFPNRAPIVIAQRGVRQSRATLEAQVSDVVFRAVGQYWDAVQARKNMEVLQKSLDLAQASYQRDKRALELGALPPLDIYRSESQVAQRKIAVLQAEYARKQAEDALRQTIGADLDARAGALDLELTEKIETESTLAAVDLREALSTALKNRQELEAQRQQLAVDDTNVKLANNNLKPDLNLSASYISNGLGGTVFDTSGATPIVVSTGGFADSLSQLGGFKFPTYGMTLRLQMPLHNSSAQADLGSALVSKRRDLYQMRSLEQSIALQIKNSVHDLELAELVMAAAKTSRDLAEKNLSAEERKYQLGAQTIFFVLDAQNQLSQAELSLVQAQIAYQKALAELDHAEGTLLEKHQVTVKP
ncbi:MAG TPA: TolC family protein [Candidatus Angelobacter sp.]